MAKDSKGDSKKSPASTAEDSKDDSKKPAETCRNLFYDFARTNALSAASAAANPWTNLFVLDEDAARQTAVYTVRNILAGDASTREKQRELESQVADLKRQVDTQALALEAEKHSSQDKQTRLEELNRTLAQLSEKERLSVLLSRVNYEAQRTLMESVEFQNKFLTNTECNTFVMSVDIRRSTELMLRARTAELFAKFITDLCGELIAAVLDCYGVLDKFTGDGILAFFPDFFTGPDAAYYVLMAADRCHKGFQSIYRAYRTAFNSVLKDTGLGIGIDYGTTRLVQMAGGLSVVGSPVVYACRMAGAPAGQTLLNQPAYERISERFSANCFVSETEVEVKHEGPTLAYNVTLSKRTYNPNPPAWRNQARAGDAEGVVVPGPPVVKAEA